MKKICIVVSNYSSEITNKLYNDAIKELKKYKKIKIKTFKAPGSFEIPVIISRNINGFDAFIAIGCIIKGKTKNFELISKSITGGIMMLSILKKKPIGNAILTCFNLSQAKKRINKGREAAKAVMSVLNDASKR